MKQVYYLLAGAFFGIVIVKSEILSWYRIQEMFYFQSFHMYGIILTAILVGFISVSLLKKSSIKSISGEKITPIPKPTHVRANIFGGVIFGLGWGLAGACPGPIFALLGSGYSIVIVVLLSALLGTLCYGLVKNKLPH